MRLRVMVQMMAEVEVELVGHADGKGAAIKPTVADVDLIISYSAHDLPDNTPPEAKPALSTVCAHMMTSMATARLYQRLNMRPEAESGGATQPPGQA